MEAIKMLGRLHEIAKQKEETKAAAAVIIKQADGLKTDLKALENEEAQLRAALETEALKASGKKLSFPGLGSVSASEKEVWKITDLNEALAIVKENPAFFDAQKIEVDTDMFIKLAKEVQTRTGDLVTCVEKDTKITTTVRLAKIPGEDDDQQQSA